MRISVKVSEAALVALCLDDPDEWAKYGLRDEPGGKVSLDAEKAADLLRAKCGTHGAGWDFSGAAWREVRPVRAFIERLQVAIAQDRGTGGGR